MLVGCKCNFRYCRVKLYHLHTHWSYLKLPKNNAKPPDKEKLNNKLEWKALLERFRFDEVIFRMSFLGNMVLIHFSTQTGDEATFLHKMRLPNNAF